MNKISWRHKIAILTIGLAALLLLRESLLPDYTLLPLDLIQTIAPWDTLDLGPLENPLISDPFYSFYPRRVLLTQAVQEGQIPSWNPTIMLGTPNTANPNFQLFYPPNLLMALILPAHQALPWLAFLHLVGTAVFMYLFLRRHTLHWMASLAGALVWMLNGYTLVWLENPHRLSTLAWIPGIFWAYETAVQQQKISWAAVGGVMLGLSILGGQMQFVFAIGLMLGVYGLTKIGEMFFQKRADMKQAVVYLVAVGLIGLGIGALIWLPANEFAGMSQRIRITSENIQQTRWQLPHLITLFAPNFYGNPVTEQAYWGVSNYAETTAYFGATAFFLALTAPFLVAARRFARYAFILTGAVLALVLGSPLARLIFALPGAQFIVLSRLLFLIPLAGSWLTAVALDGWLRQSASKKRQIASVLFAGGLIFVLAMWVKSGLGEQFGEYQQSILADLGRSAALVTAVILLLALIPRWPKTGTALIVVLIVADLLSWGWRFNPIISTEYLYPDNAVVEFLQQDAGLHRVLPLQGDKIVFGPNVLGVYGLQTIGGYTPLITANYRQLFKSIDDEVDIWWMGLNRNMLVMSHFQPLVSLLNVKYVLSARQLALDIVPQAKQEECLGTAVVSPEPLTQSFTVADPGLNRVDVTFVAAESGSIEFKLWRDRADGELIAHTVLSADEIMPDQGKAFFFAPVPDSANQTFVWGVNGVEADTAVSLCQNDAGDYAFVAYASWLQHREMADGVWIYENPNVAPRAFMVHHVERRPEDEVITTLHAPDFNWYHSAVMTESLPDEQQKSLSDAPIRTASNVAITNYQSQQVDIIVETPAAGLLVLSDSFYPGWEAMVDGEETAVYQVDHALRGVFVPAGTHEIQFRFRPKTVQTAVVIASISLLVTAVIIIKNQRLETKD
ncbi:MAG: YfhO family protein [Chloroflexi bacterium]|nr:YfhO family protein [Chloroflexota bacterium]